MFIREHCAYCLWTKSAWHYAYLAMRRANAASACTNAAIVRAEVITLNNCCADVLQLWTAARHTNLLARIC